MTFPPRPPLAATRWLSPEELAAMLGRSPGWCRRTVPGKVRLGHRTVRWAERDVLAWLAAHRAPLAPNVEVP